MVVPVNAGLASKPGKVCVKDVSIEDTGVTYHRPGDCLNAVPAVTLSELTSRFSINVDDAILKMDCEGCEFDVILNDYEHVRSFRELIFEYHGDPTLLLNALANDYECMLRRLDGVGFIHCIRKGQSPQ